MKIKYIVFAHFNGLIDAFGGIFDDYESALRFANSEDFPYYEYDIDEVKYYGRYY